MPHIVCDVRVHPEGLRRLQAIPDVSVTVYDARPLSGEARELPSDIAAKTEILIATLPPINHAAMTQLRLIQLSSVGYSQLYGLDLVARGVRVCNARGVYDTAIAEWNLAMMINLGRDLRTMIRHQERAHWEVAERFAFEARGSVVGLWGYGGIGRETARLAKQLGMTVHVLTRRDVGPRGDTYTPAGTGDPDGTLPDKVFRAGEERAFLSGLDFLILAMPHLPANTGRIGLDELRALKPTAFLLNPARGPLVQEPALLTALREGWIAGAALDTHFQYPLPPEHPLWGMPNVILTPHISGSDKGPLYLPRFWEIVSHNVPRFLEGQPLWNELTPAELNGD